MDTIVIVVLKTETHLICKLQEITDENKKGICLLMTNPYKLSLVGDGTDNFHIRFDRWCPYSIDTQYKIPYDSVLATGECDPSLKEAYLSKIQVSNNIEETNE